MTIRGQVSCTQQLLASTRGARLCLPGISTASPLPQCHLLLPAGKRQSNCFDLFWFFSQGIVIVPCISRGERTFLFQKHKYSVRDNTEAKSSLRVQALKKDEFLQVIPSLTVQTYILQLNHMLPLRQMRQGETLRLESVHLPLLSPEYRYMLCYSPTLLLQCVTEKLGCDWLRKQMGV